MNKPERYRKGGRVDPAELPRGPKGHAICRYCQTAECLPPRRTFCSSSCVHEHKIRTRGSYAKRYLFKRDRGVCSSCGEDTKKVADDLLEIRLLQGRDEEQWFKQLHGIPASRKVWTRKLGGGLWDMDHIVAVRDGGGGCGLEGLRTLCIPCHRARTAEQRKAY